MQLIMKDEDIIMDHGSWILHVRELVNMALEQRTKPPNFDLSAKHLDSLDVDERPLTHYETGICSTSCSIVSCFFDE